MSAVHRARVLSSERLDDSTVEAFACVGKQVFETRHLAEQVAQHMRRRGRSKLRAPVSAYECTFCGRWHVGNGRTRNSSRAKPAR